MCVGDVGFFFLLYFIYGVVGFVTLRCREICRNAVCIIGVAFEDKG